MAINSPSQFNEVERREELIEQSSDLINLCGFEKGKQISASELQKIVSQNQQRIKTVLAVIYDFANPEKAKAVCDSPQVQLAFVMNLQKMVELGKKRVNGAPYYVHPQSVSQRVMEFGPSDPNTLKEGVIGGLLHDYLEEGDGTSPKTVGDLINTFSGFSREMAEDLPLLTEPNYIDHERKEKPQIAQAINYDLLRPKTGQGRKTLEALINGTLLQKSKLMQTVILADKLDNISDFEIVQKKKAIAGTKTPEDAAVLYRRNVIQVLAAYLFITSKCSHPQAAIAQKELFAQIRQKISKLEGLEPLLKNITPEIKAKLDQLHAADQNPGIKSILHQEINQYYQSLGLHDVL